jgi:hypothetical protein
MMIGERKLMCLFIILTWTDVIVGFDPMSAIGIGIGAGYLSASWDKLSAGCNKLICSFAECCNRIPYNLTSKASCALCNLTDLKLHVPFLPFISADVIEHQKILHMKSISYSYQGVQ